MIRAKMLEHRFVDAFPERLSPGVLYVSIEYGSAAHSCCCGCGEEVVTPITPTDWNITYDGETVTLHPSVGSWTLPCRSHYVIRRGRVIEAPSWTDAEIAAERRRDRRAKADHFGAEHETPDSPRRPERVDPVGMATQPPVGGWWQRMRARWHGTGQ